MTAGVAGKIKVDIDLELIGANDLGTPAAPFNLSEFLGITPGTDALDQADLLFADERTLAASGTEDLDLAGVLDGIFGGTLTFAEVTAIYLKADDDNTNDVQFFGAASNGFNGPLTGTTPKLSLGPGDFAVITNRKGWTVTPSTGDLMHVANSSSGTSVTYKVVVVGRSTAA